VKLLRRLFGLDFPDPEAGQVWRSRHSGRAFQVESVRLSDCGELWHINLQHADEAGAFIPVGMSYCMFPSQWRRMLRQEGRVLGTGAIEPSMPWPRGINVNPRPHYPKPPAPPGPPAWKTPGAHGFTPPPPAPPRPGPELSGETIEQREEVCAAWADLPDCLRKDRRLTRLYHALGGPRMHDPADAGGVQGMEGQQQFNVSACDKVQMPDKARAGIEVLHRVVESLLTTSRYVDEEGEATQALANLSDCIADPPFRLKVAAGVPPPPEAQGETR